MTGIPFHVHPSGCSEVDVVWGQLKDQSEGLLDGFCIIQGKHRKKVGAREQNPWLWRLCNKNKNGEIQDDFLLWVMDEDAHQEKMIRGRALHDRR